MAYDTIPRKASWLRPTKFHVRVPDEELSIFKDLLKRSKIAPASYENSRDGFGTMREWMVEAKRYWVEEFDWSVRVRSLVAWVGKFGT